MPAIEMSPNCPVGRSDATAPLRESALALNSVRKCLVGTTDSSSGANTGVGKNIDHFSKSQESVGRRKMEVKRLHRQVALGHNMIAPCPGRTWYD